MIDPKDLVPGAVVTLKPLRVLARVGESTLLEKEGDPSQRCTWDASKLAQLAVSVTPPPPPEPEVGDVWKDKNGVEVEIGAPPRARPDGMVEVAVWYARWGYDACEVSDLTLITRAALSNTEEAASNV